MKINIGVDLHKTQFTVHFRTGAGSNKEYKTNEQGYQTFLMHINTLRAQGHEVRIGVESTGNTRFFKNYFERERFEVKVINTLKFKVINESVNKTDRHDASTIAEFLEKDMLPEARLCSESSEELRRLLKVRKTLVNTMVSVKNQIHGLLNGLGIVEKGISLKSKKGRQAVLDTLFRTANGLAVQPLFEIINNLQENVKLVEKKLEELTVEDQAVKILLTIPGCGPITAWTIRAFTDDIKRFNEYKRYASYAGLAPWVHRSNETAHYGRITKRGPEELRTALVQLVMGMKRSRVTKDYRILHQYQMMKKNKGSGKSIIATARKLSKIIWIMLTYSKPFDPELMLDKKLNDKAEEMRSAIKESA